MAHSWKAWTRRSLVLLGVVALGLAACDEVANRSARHSRGALSVCVGTDAHDKHASANIGCAVCHPCGGLLEFSEFTYTRGTSTEGGIIAIVDGTANCTVACHYPISGTPTTVAWTAGPLECVGCHQISTLPPTHPAIEAEDPTREDCLECHVVDDHTGGTVQVVGHGEAWIEPADPTNAGFHAYGANLGLARCQACHASDLSGGVTRVGCGDCHDQGLPEGVASWKVNCRMCHGGTDNDTGAPPRATWGQGADEVRVGAHTTHVTGSALAPAFDCTVCHAKPADALSQGHVDGPTAEVVFSGLAASRTSTEATWDRGTATCASTYCHGSSVGGGTNKTPVWTAVGEGQAACGTCHGLPPPLPHPEVEYDLTLCAVCHSDTLDPGGGMIPPAEGGLHLDGLVEASGHEPSWMDTASEDFHAFSANRGLGSCATCHGIDLGGGVAQTACADCHGATWRTNCTMCHGGDDNITGAPPRTTWGQGDDPIRVGAHTHHVGGGAIGGPYDCDVCHVTPPDALAADHIGGPYAGVVFSGLALQGGAAPAYTWSRAGTPEATCASTYCHGNYSGTYTYWVYDEEKFAVYAGKAATASWIDGPMGCASCHDNPPRATGVWHSGYHSGGNDCQLCHPDAAGVNGVGTSITVRASHVNGIVDVAPKWKSSCLRACH